MLILLSVDSVMGLIRLDSTGSEPNRIAKDQVAHLNHQKIVSFRVILFQVPFHGLFIIILYPIPGEYVRNTILFSFFE